MSTGTCDHNFGGGIVCTDCGCNVFEKLRECERLIVVHELVFKEVAKLANETAISCTEYLTSRLP